MSRRVQLSYRRARLAEHSDHFSPELYCNTYAAATHADKLARSSLGPRRRQSDQRGLSGGSVPPQLILWWGVVPVHHRFGLGEKLGVALDVARLRHRVALLGVHDTEECSLPPQWLHIARRVN